MKRYVSHKEVDAAKILEVINNPDIFVLVVEGQDDTELVTNEWIAKHSDNGAQELVGGYFVRYADGYTSWSPAGAFEEGYTLIN